MQNCDELFEREEFSAAADVGWPDCFNSGVFVFKPSVETYGKLIQFADSVGSFDGGDQGLLNEFYADWSTADSSRRLPFKYNTASTATYSYLPAFKHFNKDVKIIHFIGETKPWNQNFNSVSKEVQTPTGYNHLRTYFAAWWDLFCEKVHPVLSDTMVSDSLTHFYFYSTRIIFLFICKRRDNFITLFLNIIIMNAGNFKYSKHSISQSIFKKKLF